MATHPSLGLSPAAISRIASRMNPPPKAAHVDHRRVALRSTQASEAIREVKNGGYASQGNGLYTHAKTAHALWSLEREANGSYALLRLASEPDTFPGEGGEGSGGGGEGGSFGGKLEMKSGGLEVGVPVSYPLGGEIVTGRVASLSGGFADVRVGSRIDSGVPVEFLRQAQGLGANDPILDAPSSPEHEADKSMKDQMDMSIQPTAARFAAYHLASFGAILADEVLGHTYPAATLEKLARLPRTGGIRRPPTSAANLVALMGEDKTKRARSSILLGVTLRQASKTLNIPFDLAWAWRSFLPSTDPRVASDLVASLRGDRQAQHRVEAAMEPSAIETAIASWREAAAGRDPAFESHVAEAPPSWKPAVEALRTEKAAGATFARLFERAAGRTAAVSKQAVDAAAEAYWNAYFGEYGTQWVREIKRRVSADLLAASLHRQGVDQAAADYYADYYGSYGKDLAGDVDRAVSKVTTDAVKPTREAQMAPPAAPPPPPAPPPSPAPTAAADGACTCRDCGASWQGDPSCTQCTKCGGPNVEFESKPPSMGATAAVHQNGTMPLPAPLRRRDIFAGVTGFLCDERMGRNRVALVRQGTGFRILVKNGDAQKAMYRSTKDEALHAFRVALQTHVGTSL